MKIPRLGGCAGSQKRTRLSLQDGEMQGDFAEIAGTARSCRTRKPQGLSLIQEQGGHHSLAGKVSFAFSLSSSSAGGPTYQASIYRGYVSSARVILIKGDAPDPKQKTAC